MMKRVVSGFFFIALAGGLLAVATADESAKPGAVKIDSVAWLAGTWVGETGAPPYSETWGKAINGGMLGMCHTTDRKGAPSYELILIAETPKGLEYRIMHYGDGMKAKHAEPKSMQAVEAGADRIVFMESEGENPARISYRKEGPDRVVARVEHVRNGKATGFDIPLRRG